MTNLCKEEQQLGPDDMCDFRARRNYRMWEWMVKFPGQPGGPPDPCIVCDSKYKQKQMADRYTELNAPCTCPEPGHCWPHGYLWLSKDAVSLSEIFKRRKEPCLCPIHVDPPTPFLNILER